MEPIPECFEAAQLLSAAVNEHLAGNGAEAARLLALADMPKVREFTEAMWGSGCAQRHGMVESDDPPPHLPKSDRPVPRMPTVQTQFAVLARDGFHCRFCGLPVIKPLVRQVLQQVYPESISWGSSNASQHAAFQCLWLQFDHLLPNCRGGPSTIDNVVIACAPCNFGRMQATLSEARLFNPLERPVPVKWEGFGRWDGLESVLSKALRDVREG